MKLAVDRQKIERDKRLKRRLELREIASPLHQKRNMKKFKLITHPKAPLSQGKLTIRDKG